jgi:hypothetical protein
MRAWLAALSALALCHGAPAMAAPAPGGGGTTATVEGSTVTITVHIDLCCMQDAQEREIYRPILLSEVKGAQDLWNQGLAKFSAMGCFSVRVVFDARILNKGEAWDPGYHQIKVDLTHPVGRSVSYWPPNIPQNADSDWEYSHSLDGDFYDAAMSIGTWAHEIGHLMGLGDDYYAKKDFETKASGERVLRHNAGDCLEGKDTDELMCNSRDGSINQDLADRLVEILNRDGLLPQCWKGTMKISAAMLGGAGRSDTWTADIKVVVSDKGVASGTGIANRASEVKFDFVPTGPVCPSVQAFTVKVSGDADKQSLRLKFGLTDPTPPPSSGTCDQTGFQLIFTGSPTARINTIPLVTGSRAEAHLEVRDMPYRFGSIDAALDCTTCITAGAGTPP